MVNRFNVVLVFFFSKLVGVQAQTHDGTEYVFLNTPVEMLKLFKHFPSGLHHCRTWHIVCRPKAIDLGNFLNQHRPTIWEYPKI